MLVTGVFIVVDVAFFASSLLKIADGGWFPLTLGALVLFLMLTWRRGRDILFASMRTSAIPLEPFLQSLFATPPHRVPGTAVFLVANVGAVPRSMLHNLSHNKVLHERVVFLTVIVEDMPWVPFDERVAVEPLGHGCWRVTARFGFKNRTDVPQALALCRDAGLEFEMMETSFFLSRETIISTPRGGMVQWRERLFAAMARNAGSAAAYFNLPANRVIELGTQVEI
jgi:KUP system potassium uptake protein